MPFTSSPVAYPPSSSPMVAPAQKRKRTDDDREPLKRIAPNNAGVKVRAGFVMDDSDEEDELEDNAKRYEGEQPASPTRGKMLVEPTDLAPATNAESPSPAFEVGESSSGDTRPESLQFKMPSRIGGTLSPQVTVRTCTGREIRVTERARVSQMSYERMVAARSATKAGRAQKSYYGVDIHSLMDELSKVPENPTETRSRPDESHLAAEKTRRRGPKTLLWTEKYRARKFTDLIGDERTHRSVLRWLKSWDSIVFPAAHRQKPKARPGADGTSEEYTHRKLLLLTGPPGLGKTTLAHICAKQAGYEAHEINASDDRSRDVVHGRIRDMVGTENVKTINSDSTAKKGSARPVCVIVDEVDGVVSGSGGAGEGGFVKALVDLLALDQKNTTFGASQSGIAPSRKKKKGDTFRLLRPIILICNDVYHPSLRLLRQGPHAEVIHMRKPPIGMVIPRLQSIFEKEGLRCDKDAVRRLCEATWGIKNSKEERSAGGSGEGDVRGILVVGEWVASKFRAESCAAGGERLTKKWIEDNVLSDLAHGGGAARGLGRGSSKEVVDRVFLHNAGFSTSAPARSVQKGSLASVSPAMEGDSSGNEAVDRLRHMIETSGEDERIMNDCFATYPLHPFQDDTMLTKPCHAYDWLHFHDTVSSLVHSSHEWELAPYLSHPILAFHHLFASPSRHSAAAAASHGPNPSTADDADPNAAASAAPHPLTTPRAAHIAAELQKSHGATLQHLQTHLSPPLHRAFRSAAALATELVPYVLRILSPDVRPVVVGGSDKGVASVRRGAEKELVARAVSAMVACGVRFDKGRLEAAGPAAAAVGSVYRMEPPLDELGVFETAAGKGVEVRFAVRQVLDQECRRELVRREQEARLRRARGLYGDEGDDDAGLAGLAGGPGGRAAREVDKDGKAIAAAAKSARNGPKKDFFGRLVFDPSAGTKKESAPGREGTDKSRGAEGERVWVTYHEGFSNAVRKPITLKELLEGM